MLTSSLDELLVGIGRVEVRFVAVAAEREDDATGAEHEHHDRQDPDEQTHTRILRAEEDRLAVAVDVRLADLGVALASGDAPLDVGADRTRGRRLAVGDREPLALGALELGLQIVSTCGRRLCAVRPKHHREGDRHHHAQGDPWPPPPDHPDARAAARKFSRSEADMGPYFAATTSPLGEIAYVSGWPRVAKSSAAAFSGSSAIVQSTPCLRT